MTDVETRMLFSKREDLENILGNGDLLLNGMFVQCPICGSIISLGHFNKIVFNKDHLYEHFKKAHFKDPVRSSTQERSLAYLCMQRYDQYFSNNKKMLLPQAMKCSDGGIHAFIQFEIPGTRSSLFDKSPLKVDALDILKVENLICEHHKNEIKDNDGDSVDFDVDTEVKVLSNAEFKCYAQKVFDHFDVSVSNLNLFIQPNTQLNRVNESDVQDNGILVSQQCISPSLIRIQELINNGTLSPSHPFFQEIELFSKMYGNLSNDPVRSFGDIKSRYPALMYLQERIRKAATGKAAYNLYLGKHNVGTGNQSFSSSSTLPEIENVFHFGLAPSSWIKKEICPALFDGPMVQFILLLLDVIPAITKVKSQGASSTTVYASLIFDQKGISPGAEEYDGIIHGVIPLLTHLSIENLCSQGYSRMLKALIGKFKDETLKWVKQVEVFMVQLLDMFVAVPIASYSLQETGDSDAVQKRIEEVCLYANACQNCLQESIDKRSAPECNTYCKECFKDRKICPQHKDIYSTWVSDDRPCEKCVTFKKKCVRLKMLSTISDMDPSYQKFGKNISRTFEEQLSEEKFVINHVHDIGHNIKNAESSLERGSHFDGRHTYDSNDVTVLLSSVDDEGYKKLNGGLSHRAVLQYDKQSDELSLQRLSSNVISSLSSVRSLLKTDVPEGRRPWFAENHDGIGKPLFVVVSQNGVVFTTDDYNQRIFFYRQTSLRRKVCYIGKKESDENMTEDPSLRKRYDVNLLTWKSIGGMTLFREEQCLIVADLGFRSIRILQGSKLVRVDRTAESKPQAIKNLYRLPNMKFFCHSIRVDGNKETCPCGLLELPNGHLAVTDPINSKVLFCELSDDLRSSVPVASIKLTQIEKPFDCAYVSGGFLAITDISQTSQKVHVISVNSKEIVSSFAEEGVSPTCVCAFKDTLIFTDSKNHCVYVYDWERKQVDLLIGAKSSKGFDDGPPPVCRLISPFGVCCRGETVYIAEHPEESQGAVRVFCELDGLIRFKTIWQSISRCFGMISRREKNFLQSQDPSFDLKSTNLLQLKTELLPHANNLSELIAEIRDLHKVQKLDIIYGSMASQTAEAVYVTYKDYIEIIHSYFCHIDKGHLLSLMLSKCMTTRLIECFFGHITTSVQGNNLRFLEMKRKISNEAFTFLLPYVNSKSSGLSIRSEKERVVETYSYSLDDNLSSRDGALIWRFLQMKEKNLLTIEKKRQIKNRLAFNGTNEVNGSLTFGTSTHCFDYFDIVDVQSRSEESKSHFREVSSALKSRAMRSLRGFCKRRFGTAPTILGTHSSRIDLQNMQDILSYIQDDSQRVQEQEEIYDNNENVLAVGEFVVFRGTDNYSFNVIQLTKSYNIQELQPKAKIFGNFLIPEDEKQDKVIFFVDPQWKGGSMQFKDVLKDEHGSIVTGEFQLEIDDDRNGIFYSLGRIDFELISDTAIKFEEEITITADLESIVEEEEEEEDLGDREDEPETQPVVLTRRGRERRGNKYASVIASLLN